MSSEFRTCHEEYQIIIIIIIPIIVNAENIHHDVSRPRSRATLDSEDTSTASQIPKQTQTTKKHRKDQTKTKTKTTTSIVFWVGAEDK